MESLQCVSVRIVFIGKGDKINRTDEMCSHLTSFEKQRKVENSRAIKVMTRTMKRLQQQQTMHNEYSEPYKELTKNISAFKTSIEWMEELYNG